MLFNMASEEFSAGTVVLKLYSKMEKPKDTGTDWSRVCMHWVQYAEVRTCAKKEEQEEMVRARDILEGRDPTGYVWSDLDTGFRYTAADVPVLDVQGRKSIKIVRYRALDRWVGQIRTEETRWLKNKLDKSLSGYCESIPSDSTVKCKVGQLCFVKLPKFSEVDEIMESAIGKSRWAKRRRPETRKEHEDKFAGWWVRAECNGISGCKQFGKFTSIDTGRSFPARWTNVRQAVYRFLTFPSIAFPCILLLSNPAQITWGVHEKWYQIMERGSHFTFNIVGNTSDETLLLRLARPTEDELDQRYKEGLNGQPDPTEDPDDELYNPPDHELVRTGTFL